MRVIAGILGGRSFASPRGHRTHPMSDKVRGALFNALGDIQGLTVLDAFAGSGALGFEAISRGARSAMLIDIDAAAQRAISENIQTLGIKTRAKLIKASAHAWLSTTDENFDLVLVDPPYDSIQRDLIFRLAGRVKPGGIAALSLPPDAAVELPADFQLIGTKNYGDAQLFFYRRAS